MNQNKNILHIIYKLTDQGGTPNKLYLLNKYKSINVKYYFITFDSENELTNLRKIISKDAKIINLKNKFNLIYNIYKITNLIKKNNIETICVHFFKSTFYGFFSSIIVNKRLVIFENGINDNKSIIKELFYKFINIKNLTIICNSLNTKRSIQKRYKNRQDLHIINNGIEDFDSVNIKSTYTKSKESLNLIFIGGLIDLRNPELLIKSCSKLNINFTLKIIGHGPNINRINNLIKKLNLNNNIKLLGNLNKKDLFREIKKSDLFLTCTKEEGFGYSVFEAITLNIPILVYKKSSYSELINYNINCNFYNQYNCKSISDKIADINSNYDQVKNRANLLRKFVMDKFSMKKFVKNIESKY